MYNWENQVYYFLDHCWTILSMYFLELLQQGIYKYLEHTKNCHKITAVSPPYLEIWHTFYVYLTWWASNLSDSTIATFCYVAAKGSFCTGNSTSRGTWKVISPRGGQIVSQVTLVP